MLMTLFYFQIITTKVYLDAKKQITEILKRLNLKLNNGKSKNGNIIDEGFDYLGYHQGES